MSDLAPFVAAVLNDKVVDGLQKELEQEKEKNGKLESALKQSLSRMIRITGPGGSPIYAERHYFEGEHEDDDYALHLVNSTANERDTRGRSTLPANPALATCKVEDFYDSEIHVGTKKVFKMSSGDKPSFIGAHAADCALFVRFLLADDWDFGVVVTFGLKEGIEIQPPEDLRNDEVEYVCFEDVTFYRDPFGNFARFG